MMVNYVKHAVKQGKSLLLVCATSAMLTGCLLNSAPVPVVYGDGARYSPYSMPDLKNGERVITVAPGDTVSQLTTQYHTDFQRFTARNKLKSPYVIYPGQRLVLPPWQPDYNSMPPESAVASTSSRATQRTQARTNQTQSSPARKSVTIGGKQQVVTVSRQPESRRKTTPRAASSSHSGSTIPVPGIKPQEFAAAAQRRDAAKRSWNNDTRTTAVAGQGTIDQTVSLAEPKDRSGFVWPVQGKVVLKYGAGTGGLFNDGINIQANRGTPVVAADNGVVTYVGNELRGFGNLILIKHADNFVTAYAHSENPLVARGDVVTRGQHIASVGSTGAVTFPQLHFEVRKGRQSADPMKYLPNVLVSR
ncbi:peptidoglycan DD-metalloendopeptidase family protein [Thalassospira sp. MA62]|nr:peptidoglycan DD-metalloendopeptidase family protein [Thalassospira sp. MA62]